MLGWLYIRALVEYLSHFNFRAFFWLNMISLNLSNCIQLKLKTGFPGSLDNKESACSAGDLGWIPGSGKLPSEGKGYPLQYFAWKITWKEEPGGLQSMGLQRVEQDWVTNKLQAAELHPVKLSSPTHEN